MASLVSRGTTTLRARSTLPDAWITWRREGVRGHSQIFGHSVEKHEV